MISLLGLTGTTVAPWCSAQALIFTYIAAFGRLGESDAPMTATVRGRKNPSRSTGRNATGRPLTSSFVFVGNGNPFAFSDTRVRFVTLPCAIPTLAVETRGGCRRR